MLCFLWEIGDWGFDMTALVVVLMIVVMMVVVMIVVLVLVLMLMLVLGLLGKGANERKDVCEKGISTTWGCAFGEIAVVAARGVVLVRDWGYLRFNLWWAASRRLRSSTRARDGEGVQQGVLRLCCMVPVCELCVRWSGRSGGSVLCASDEG